MRDKIKKVWNFLKGKTNRPVVIMFTALLGAGASEALGLKETNTAFIVIGIFTMVLVVISELDNLE